MSLFRTVIPIDLKPLTDSLPSDVHIHAIELNKGYHPVMDKEPPSCLIVEWESSKFKTPYTTAVDYPLEDLQRSRVPSSVRKLLKAAKALLNGGDGVKPESVLQAQNAPIPDPQLRTPEQVQEAVTAGKPVEYQGVEPRWLPIEPGHAFTEGYYYRIKPGVT